MIAHDPAAAKRTGVPQSVGKEFQTSGERYKQLPESKSGSPKKKGWIKKEKGEKRLKSKIAQKETKTEQQRLESRYGSK
jgi:hypothetical protein